MKICYSTTVLASILSPAFSFSYLESLGGANTNPVAYSPPAAAAPSNGASYLDALSGAAAAPAAVAEPVATASPPAPTAVAPSLIDDGSDPAPTSGKYLEALSTGASATSGAGLPTYKDSLPSINTVGGAGIQSYTSAIPSASVISGGSGLLSHTDSLSGGAVSSGNFTPFGSTKPSAPAGPSFSGTTSGSPVDFTLETSNLSGMLEGLSGSGTITLSGSIDSVSFQ